MRALLGIREIWLVRRDCKCLKVRLIRYGILQYLQRHCHLSKSLRIQCLVRKVCFKRKSRIYCLKFVVICFS